MNSNKIEESTKKILGNEHKKLAVNTKEEIALAKADAELEDYKNTTILRRGYGVEVFKFAKGWMIFTGAVLLMNGLNIGQVIFHHYFKIQVGPLFQLERSVLWVLLGTTSLNVIAMVVAVIKGIFPKDTTKS